VSNRAGEVLGRWFGISAAQRGHSALTSSPFLLVAPAAVPIVGVTGCLAIDVVAGRRVVHADADDRGVLLEHPRNAHDVLVAGVCFGGHSGRRRESTSELAVPRVERGVGQGRGRGKGLIWMDGRMRALANAVDVVDDVRQRSRASLKRGGREWRRVVRIAEYTGMGDASVRRGRRVLREGLKRDGDVRLGAVR
jgi:hypothetical protein